MNTDKRNHPRFRPNGLLANITIVQPPPAEVMTIDGTVIDMSYTGIKIQLNQPILNELPLSEISINLIMPESGIPVSIHGLIKHLNNNDQCGLAYTEQHPEHKVDNLMFECIKIANDHTQD